MLRDGEITRDIDAQHLQTISAHDSWQWCGITLEVVDECLRNSQSGGGMCGAGCLTGNKLFDFGAHDRIQEFLNGLFTTASAR